MFVFPFRQRSFQNQDQGGGARKHGPQGDSAEAEKDVERGQPEEEGHEVAGAVPEEWRRLPLPAAGQPGEPVSNHGPQSG